MRKRLFLISFLSILVLILEFVFTPVYAIVDASKTSSSSTNSSVLKDLVVKLKPDKLKEVKGDDITEDNKTHFSVVDSVDKFKEKSHYIVATYNKKENKFYALAANSNGYQKEIPVSSIDELKNGLDLDNDLLETEEYIFTCSNDGTKESDYNISGIKFKSNVVNDDGKKLSIKLGTSDFKPWPVFDASAGGLIIEKSDIEEDSEPFKGSNLATWKINKNGGGSLNYFPYFPAEHELYAPGNTNSFFTPVYIDYTGLTYSDDFAIWNSNSAWDEEQNDWISGNFYCYTKIGKEEETGNLISISSYDAGWFKNNSFTSTDWNYYSEYSRNGYKNERSRYPFSDFVILSDYQEEENQDKEMIFTKAEKYGDLLQSYYNVNYLDDKRIILVYTDENGNKHILGDIIDNVQETNGENNNKIITTSMRNSFTVSYSLEDSVENGFHCANVYNYDYENVGLKKNTEFLNINDIITMSSECSPIRFYTTAYDYNQYTKYKVQDLVTGKFLGWSNGEFAPVDTFEGAASLDVYISDIVKYKDELTYYNYDKYYKVTDLEDLKEGDKLLITYDLNGQKYILSSRVDKEYSPFNNYSLIGLMVMDNGDPVDIYDYDNYSWIDSGQMIPRAYVSDDNSIMMLDDTFIYLTLGEEKSKSSKQYKFKSLKWDYDGSLYLNEENIINRLSKNAWWNSYYGALADKSNKEISFFIDDNNNFLLRGSKEYLASIDVPIEDANINFQEHILYKLWVNDDIDKSTFDQMPYDFAESACSEPIIINMEDGKNIILVEEMQVYYDEKIVNSIGLYCYEDDYERLISIINNREPSNEIVPIQIPTFYNINTGEKVSSQEESVASIREYESQNIQTISVAKVSNDVEKALPIEIYRKTDGTANPIITYYEVDGETVENSFGAQGRIQLPKKDDVLIDGTLYTFVGWTSNKEKSGYLDVDKSANIYDYDDLKEIASVKQNIIDEYGLINDCNHDIVHRMNVSDLPKDENGNVNLYPLYAVKGYDTVVNVEEGGRKIIGISDWKMFEENDGFEDVNKEVWLGSIDVEFYLDGEKWGNTEKMYFRYHNDNAADINLKFIDDSLVEEKDGEDKLYLYMNDNSLFPEKSQVDDYVIDGIYAEQGGSEGGLKYLYNWATNYGGQLDNVKGGSTIKVYVSTKYKVKYYLDNELLGDTEETKEYKDESFYKTLGTTNAFEVDKNNSNYNVSMENEYSKLMDRSETEDKFLNDVMIRGEYSKFTYDMNEANNIIDIAKAPEIDASKIFKNQKWVVKDRENNEVLEISPETDFEIEGSEYGTGNTIFAYRGENEEYNTYHLYLETIDKPVELRNISIQKVVDASVEDKDKIKDTKFKFELVLKDENNENISGEFECEGIEDNVITFINGKAEIELKDNEKVIIKNIPYGTKYSVEEILEENSKFKIDYEKSTALDGKIGHEDIITNVLNNHKGTLIVHYLEKDTEEKLIDDKYVNDLDIGSEVTEEAVNIKNYEKVPPTKETIEIQEGKNEITFYYEKKEVNPPSIKEEIINNYITNEKTEITKNEYNTTNYNIINNNIVNNYYNNDNKNSDVQIIRLTDDGGSASTVKSTGSYASSTASKYDDEESYKKDPDTSTPYVAKVPSTGDKIGLIIFVVVSIIFANIALTIYVKKNKQTDK